MLVTECSPQEKGVGYANAHQCGEDASRGRLGGVDVLKRKKALTNLIVQVNCTLTSTEGLGYHRLGNVCGAAFRWGGEGVAPTCCNEGVWCLVVAPPCMSNQLHCLVTGRAIRSHGSKIDVGCGCCEATTACQHTSPLRHLWLILVTLRASSSQRHQRLPFQFRKASTQANKSKVKNTTLTHREHNSRHQGPQAGSFWRQLLIFTGTPAADSFGANLLPCCPPAALLTSPRALSPHTRAFSPTCFCIALCSSFSLLLFLCLLC